MTRHPLPPRATACAAALALGLLAGGCSRDVDLIGAAPEPRDRATPDFVAESRKSSAITPGTFMPVGVSAPARPIRAKSSAGTRTLEAELEGARGRNESKGRAAESAGRATKPASAPVQ